MILWLEMNRNRHQLHMGGIRIFLIACLITFLFLNTGCQTGDTSKTTKRVTSSALDQSSTQESREYADYFSVSVGGEIVGSEKYRYEPPDRLISEVTRKTDKGMINISYSLSQLGDKPGQKKSSFEKKYSENGSVYVLSVNNNLALKDCPIFEPDVAALVIEACRPMRDSNTPDRTQAIIPSRGLSKKQIVRIAPIPGYNFGFEITSEKLQVFTSWNLERGGFVRLGIPSMNLEIFEVTPEGDRTLAYYRTLSYIYFYQRIYDQAEVNAQNALKIDPENEDVKALLDAIRKREPPPAEKPPQ